MISRYQRKEMAELFTDQNKFDTFLKIEVLNAMALNELKVIPDADLLAIKEKAGYNLERVYELEKETKHDVIAFTRSVSETLGSEKKWIHYGLTSTDVVDTANAFILKQANKMIVDDIAKLLITLKEKALKYKMTPIIGRTHGIHADITSFGLKFALFYSDMKRNLNRFLLAAKDIEVGKISGAVGNYANVNPYQEEFICKNLGLDKAAISTQVIQRDRYAYYLSVIALIGSELEKMATEIRHLQRTEIKEASEAFSQNQKGSSAMPHKKNPIGSENICGCARVLRGYMLTSYEDINLWHERDISHSSAERIIIPDSISLIDYMLNRMNGILQNLVVYEENMLKNIYKTNGVIFSQRVLYALISKGLSREQAYDLVQKQALKAYEADLDFKALLLEEGSILTILSEEEVDECFTLEYYFKNVDYIYQNVGLI